MPLILARKGAISKSNNQVMHLMVLRNLDRMTVIVLSEKCSHNSLFKAVGWALAQHYRVGARN